MRGHSISVVLVDDHPVVRDGYSKLLQLQDDINVLAEFSDGESACAYYSNFNPDITILDLNMHGIGGLETIRRIAAKHPSARILVFTMHESSVMVTRALDAGARGYLTKSSSAAEMIDAVRQVASDRTYLAKNLPSDLHKTDYKDNNPVDQLTKREFQVFCALAEGRSVSEIASTIFISPKTVGVHQTNLMKKLHLKNTSELTHMAIQSGIVAA